MAQVIVMEAAVNAEKYKCNVKTENVITDNKATFIKLVDFGGLFLLRIVGMRAITKPICADAIT